MFKDLIHFIREQYQTKEIIPLHEPVFSGNERNYILQSLQSTQVSSIGEFVNKFENKIEKYTKCGSAVAVINGTAALHTSLIMSGLKSGDCVITQPLTFVATCNAITYCGAEPIFVDVDRETMGLSPEALEIWLTENALINENNVCIRKKDKKPIKVCLPMHTFGHPVQIKHIEKICDKWFLTLVEDAAEALGSSYQGKALGTFGKFGAISFNGNKIISTGGGGMILTDKKNGVKAKHLTTTARINKNYEYIHDTIGYNYRLPNLNAALGIAQMEQLDYFLNAKRTLAKKYQNFFKGSNLNFFSETPGSKSNYWLNAVICEDRRMRDTLIKITNNSGIATRPIWKLMNELNMFQGLDKGDLSTSKWLHDRVVCLPSSVIQGI